MHLETAAQLLLSKQFLPYLYEGLIKKLFFLMGGGKATTHVPWWKVDSFVGPTRGRRTFVNLLGTRSRSLKHTTFLLPLFTQIHKQIK